MKTTPNPWAIILGAGRSSRMGSDKLLLPIDGKAAILLLLDTALSVCENVALALGANYDAVAPVVAAHPQAHRVRLAVNPQPQRGMFSSVQTGLAIVPRGALVFVQPADQPLVRPEVYRCLLAALQPGDDAAAPALGERGGHPVLLSADFAHRLRQRPATSNLRDELLACANVRRVPVNDPATLHNWNTPADIPTILREGDEPDK
ncbi:MAG: nucleotidyltransferase family protein [Candidatus Cloacimonetes bacterium]|nr:nucleotidyltransferase family protein [Candidatus Cloacimonadota bacterium]